MKRFTLVILALGLLSTFFMAGCSNPDGPSFSDDDLLKRGKGGHDAATSGAKTQPK